MSKKVSVLIYCKTKFTKRSEALKPNYVIQLKLTNIMYLSTAFIKLYVNVKLPFC